jgi:hypothetical protein
MTEPDGEPTIEVGKVGDGVGYCVIVTWPNGGRQFIPRFQSEAEANSWIADKSAQWIAGRNP